MSNVPLPPPAAAGFCGNCGAGSAPGAAACLRCGFAPTRANNFCQRCATPATPGQAVCIRCGFALRNTAASGEKSKVAAGLLGIFLGGFGVHKFYLGYTTPAIVMLAVTVGGGCLALFVIGLLFAWVPSLIGLIEGIIYLTKSDEDFHDTYVANKREWF